MAPPAPYTAAWAHTTAFAPHINPGIRREFSEFLGFLLPYLRAPLTLRRGGNGIALLPGYLSCGVKPMRSALLWRGRLLLVAVLCATIATLGSPGMSSLALGQDSAGSRGSGSESGPPAMGSHNPGGGLGGVGSGGGMSMADFGSLMMLIQQTIDPDSWIEAGGTSAMFPYPNGVFVDPAGQVKRREVRPFDASAFGQRGLSHPWRMASGLRIVSLKGLEQALAERQAVGLAPSREMLQIAGLSQITAVKIDVENQDILLAGPANAGELGMMLEDLAVVAASVNRQTTPLGCSIDPRLDGLQAAQAFLAQPGTTQRLASNPRLFASQLQDKVGEHQVTFFGINPKSATALALLDADEHMKRVGFGQERTAAQVKTYFDFVGRHGQAPAQSLVRWWFSYAPAPIGVNLAGDVFQLPENCVAVMSEQQFVTAQGRRPSGGKDLAADAFAQSMTESLPELRKTLPSYARLCSVFESALALQLAIEATDQTSLYDWFPTLCGFGSSVDDRAEQVVVPKSVPGLAITHRLKNGTVMAVVSGGVTMNPQELASRRNWQASQFLASSAVPRPPERRSSAQAQWWWD
jgi:hypothetical protein